MEDFSKLDIHRNGDQGCSDALKIIREKVRDPLHDATNLEDTINRAEAFLDSYGDTPFQIVKNLNFSNSIATIAEMLSDFIASFSPKLIFFCINDFGCNGHHWEFEILGYEECPPYSDGWFQGLDPAHFDYDFGPNGNYIRKHQKKDRVSLADDDANFLLNSGMSSLQALYETDPQTQDPYMGVKCVCDEIVLAKFQLLIRKSIEQLSNCDIPIFIGDQSREVVVWPKLQK